MDERHVALVDAMAGEHRLRRQAVREAQEAELWTARASMAQSRGLEEMATAAQARAERHLRMERLLLARADDMRVEIERMRQGPPATLGLGRAPPLSEATLESRMARLEIEQEIEAIRVAVAARGSTASESEQRQAEQRQD